MKPLDAIDALTRPPPSHRVTVSPSHRPARIALLGCGTVGREVARRLLAEGDSRGLSLVRVLVRDTTRDRGVPRELLTGRFADVLDAEPDLVIEAIGGLDPAADFVRASLERGLHVVTANKTLIAHHAESLRALADAHGAGLACEAAVCAGVPVLAAIRHLAADEITAIRGVVNGTCNFILSWLGEGRPFDEALAQARSRGFAEPDPSADLSGRDSAEKLCVLASAAGFRGVTPDRVTCDGIESVTPDDVRAARRSGHALKLLAELESDGDGVSLRVGPTLVPREHPLASTRDEENAVVISTAHAGDITLRGPGAGPGPTTSAILGDIATLLDRRPTRTTPHQAPKPARSMTARRHAVRVSAPRHEPGRVFDTAREQAVRLDEVEFSPGAVRGVTGGVTPAAATHWAASIDPADSLVMPILNHPAERAPNGICTPDAPVVHSGT